MRRDENSILFSLTHLQNMALATPSPMAQPTGNATPAPVVTSPYFDSDGPVLSPIVPSTLIAGRSTGYPAWLLPTLIGMGTLLFAVLVVTIVVAFRADDAAPVVTTAPIVLAQPSLAPTPPSTPTKADNAGVSTASEKPSASAPSSVEETSAGPKLATKQGKKKLAKWAKHRRAKRARFARIRPSSPSPGEEALAVRSTKKSRDPDELDALLDRALAR